MGGIGIGMASNLYINPSNPALYAEFDTLSFLFDLGVYSESRNLNTIKEKESYNNAGLDYITFGLSITKWWKTSFGVVPFSKVAYKIIDKSYLPDVGNTTYSYEGTGAINRAYWGHALKIGGKNYIALGANLNYLFGKTKDIQAVMFPDSLYYFHTKHTQSITYHDLFLDVGTYLNYEVGKNDDYVLGLGAIYSLGKDINTRATQLSYTYTLAATGVDKIKDTLFFAKDNATTVGLPQSIAGGFSLKKKNRYRWGIDVRYQNWKTFHVNGVNDMKNHSLRIASGGQYMPGGETLGSYWNWVRYRAGVYFNQSALYLNDTRINEFGITFGVGLPLRRSRSTINLSLNIGNRGTTDQGLIKETSVTFRLGFSIYENWFIQQKFR